MIKIKITGHNIEMFSSWEKKAVYKREESIDLRKIRIKRPANSLLDQLSITSDSKKLLENELKTNKTEKTESAEEKFELSEEDRQKILLLEAFLSKLKGEKVKIKLPIFLKLSGKKGENKSNETNSSNTALSWQLNYSLSESYVEKEKINFSAKAFVKTADGKEINVDLKLNMSREFAVSRNIDLSISKGEPVDPVVINYAGQAADFKETTYEFDLDADGVKEEIPHLKSGSGFLVLADDGSEIKDGSQLFGPQTGDGFAEMKEYDEDNNGWLDSGDSIFDNLKIWTKDESGNDRLFALADKNIGALYLGNINAKYSYKNELNESRAVNKKMSLYLTENGTAGSVQELDFIV
ncbi:MAG: hypothetical protein ACQERL_09450 [Bacillota bacterium]